MVSKSDIKLIRSLAIKKYRAKHELFVAEGEKIISDILRDEYSRNRYRIRSIFSTDDWEPPDQMQQTALSGINRISDKELKQCSFLSTPNKVLAIVEIPVTPLIIEETSKGITLVLEAVRDPGNLGTIIRMAHWFGVENIICSEDSVDLYNPKTIQSTMGSFVAVNVHYLNLVEFLGKVKNDNSSTTYGSYLEGENIYTLAPDSNAIIVLGNESAGIDNQLEQFIDKKICIPSFSIADKPDSLNVANAAAILLSEFLRNSDSNMAVCGE